MRSFKNNSIEEIINILHYRGLSENPSYVKMSLMLQGYRRGCFSTFPPILILLLHLGGGYDDDSFEVTSSTIKWQFALKSAYLHKIM